MAIPTQYASSAELQAAPLGLSLKNLGQPNVGPVTGTQVHAAITNLIMSASSAADSYCEQVATATQDTETALTEQSKAWIDREGYLWFKVENAPILYVSSLRYSTPAINSPAWNDVVTPNLIFMGRNMVGAPLMLPQRGMMRFQVELTYVNGYANAFLTAPALAGDLTIFVSDITGFITGRPVTIFDGGKQETVRVASTYVPSALSENGIPTPGAILLSTPLVYAHIPVDASTVSGIAQPYDIRVSSLPFDFTWAVLLICKSFIQEKGSSALVMGSTSGIRGRTEIRISTDEIPEEAKQILDRYKAVF